MTTSFLALCPSCGEQAVSPADVALLLDEAGGGAAYRTLCPQCHTAVHQVAESATAELLQALGARMFVVPAAPLVHEEGVRP